MYDRIESVNRIILSIGHGGLTGEDYDPGAINSKTHEVENIEAKQIVMKLAQYLTNAGLAVLILPDFGLQKTITYVNAMGDAHTDWAFEIHKDSTNAYTDSMKRRMGIYYHPSSTGSKEIAEVMIAEMKRNGASESSWARVDTDSNHTSLGWIRKPKMLSHLIEAGFMQDKNDNESDTFYAGTIGAAICAILKASHHNA